DTVRGVRPKSVPRSEGDLAASPGYLRRAIAWRDQENPVEPTRGSGRTIAHDLVESELDVANIHVRRARVRRDGNDLRWCVIFRTTRRRACRGAGRKQREAAGG